MASLVLSGAQVKFGRRAVWVMADTAILARRFVDIAAFKFFLSHLMTGEAKILALLE